MATLTVISTGGGDYTTIQAAVNAAAAGDWVEIQDSATYNEAIAPPTSGGRLKEVHIRAGTGHSPIWDLTGKDYALSIDVHSTDFTTRAVQIQGIHFQNFSGFHAVFLQVKHAIQATRCTFTDCTKVFRYATGSTTARTIIDRCWFDNCATPLFGNASVGSDYVDITNTVLIGAVNEPGFIWKSTNVRVRHSTIYSKCNSGKSALSVGSANNNVILNASTYSGGTAIDTPASGHGYNCVYGTWSTAFSGGAGTGDINVDPLLTDPGADDFTLQASSPCIDTGTDLSVTEDYAGDTRPTGSGPDMGAYEWVSPLEVTGATLDSMTAVTVAFNLAPDAADVENTADWTVVSTSGGGAVSVTAVAVDGTDVTLTLSGLEHGHDYTVTAVNSGADPDDATFSTPVAVADADLDGLTTIVVTFDGAPTADDVNGTSDWTVVSTTGGGAVTVTAAAVDGEEVTLTVSGLARGHTYTVTAVNAGASPATAEVSVPVAVDAVSVTGASTVVVTFDGTPDAADVQDTNDWTVVSTTGGGTVTVTGVSVVGDVVTLTVSGLSSGHTYTVTSLNASASPASDAFTYVVATEATVAPPSATERWVASEVQALFNALLPGNRVDPVQNEILLDLFEVWARLRVYTRHTIIGLRDLLDPFSLPDEWLPHLGGRVLFTPDTGIPGHLTADQWRAIIPSAGAMWRQKGIDLRPILVALQGQPVWIGAWHDLRHQLDVTDGLPLLGYDAADDGSNHERTITVHMADPIGTYSGYTPADGESALNRDLVRLLIGAVRPAGQRVDVFFFDWLDDFSQGLGQWTSEAGRAPAWDSDAWTMTLDSATDSAEVIVQQVAGDVADEFEYATWELWIKLAEAVRTEIRLRHDGTDYHELRITPSATDATAGAVALVHTTAGSIATTSAATVPLGVWLFVRVTCAPVTAGDDEWSVDIDGDRVLTGTLAAQTNTGPMQLRIASGQVATVQLVEQYQAPADTIRIGPED